MGPTIANFWGELPAKSPRNGDGEKNLQSPDSHPHRRREEVTIETFADLRDLSHPEKPEDLMLAWPRRVNEPLTPEHVDVMKFSFSEFASRREARWAYWKRLSHCGIFVQPYYRYSKWEMPSGEPINASAKSPGGQEVVTSTYGTIMLMVSTSRLYLPNHDETLTRRLRAVFPPLNLATDSKGFTRTNAVAVAPRRHSQMGFRI